jgi:hypothetical protein
MVWRRFSRVVGFNTIAERIKLAGYISNAHKPATMQSNGRRFGARFPERLWSITEAETMKENSRKHVERAACAALVGIMHWLRGEDLNLRPLGYEPNELPDCSTPLWMCGIIGSPPF